MKKILLPIMILCTAVSANAVARFFTGGELGAEIQSGDMTDIANYTYFSGKSNVSWSSFSGSLTAEGDASGMDAFPGWQWIGYGDFAYTPTGETTAIKYDVPTTLTMANSHITTNHNVFCYSKENAVVNVLLGSANSDESTFKYQTAAQRFNGSSTSTVNIIRTEDAAQERFEIVMLSNNKLEVHRGTVNYGTIETGALSYISTYEIDVLSGNLSLYADRIIATNAATTTKTNADTGEVTVTYNYSEIKGGSSLTLVISENGISDVDATLTLNHALKLAEGAVLNIDFSAFEEVYEDTFVLIQASGFEGLTSENVDDIVGVIGLEGKSWDLDIVDVENAQQLQITISPAVPEPSTVASILGILALGFVAYRRRK